MSVWTGIVLAAGKGTRMRSSLPKVLHLVAGRPLVAHALRAVRAIGPSAVLLLTSPASRKQVEAEAGSDVECVDQAEPLGTGHALATALIRMDSSTRQVLVVNGDVPLVREETIEALKALHEKRQATLTLLTCTMTTDALQEVGLLHRGARGKPIAIVEAQDASQALTGSVEVNVGVYAFEVDWLRRAITTLPLHESGEYFLTDLLAKAVADGMRVEAHSTDDVDEALSVNSRADLARVEHAMQGRLRRKAMASGATLVDPETTFLDTMVEVGEDVTVQPNTSLRGDTCIGPGVTIGPNAQLRDAHVGPDCSIGAAIIEGAVLERGVSIGPFSYVRPGTILEENAYIGSHVEIKASRIGSGVHIGHFSYVGDAVIGANANIGAGTVTCNYDGVSKHLTEIGEDALIGSDTLLIAPVKVGAGAVTGAGAVVNKDVPPGGRVAGVPARPLRSRGRKGALAASEGGRSLG